MKLSALNRNTLSVIKTIVLSAIVTSFHTINYAQESGKRVYQKDSLGNSLYHKQSWVIESGKMCPVDVLGNREYHKFCFDIGCKEMTKAPGDGKKRP